MSTIHAPTSGAVVRHVDTDSLVKRAMAFGALQVLAGLGLATNIVATVRQIPLLAQERSALADLSRLDDVRSASTTAALILGLLAGVAFLVWVHEAVRNQEAIASLPPPWSPAGTVGRLFVPIYNFYVFYRAFQGLWSSSGPARPIQDEGNPAVGLLVVLGVVLMIASILINQEFNELNRWGRPSIEAVRVALQHSAALQTGLLAFGILQT